MSAIITGHEVYTGWRKQDNFNTMADSPKVNTANVGDPSNAVIANPFGFNLKITGLTTAEGAHPLQDLGHGVVTQFAYGKLSRNFSAEWILSDHRFLELIMGKFEGNTYSYAQAIVPFTQFLTFGFEEGDTTKINRQLIGCLLNSVNIRFGVGQEDVMCNASVLCGIDGSDTDIDMSADNLIDEPEHSPYTFDHAKIMVGEEKLGEAQNVELTIDPKHQLVYKTGQAHAASGHKTLTEYRGKATFTFVGGAGLELVKRRGKEMTMSIMIANSPKKIEYKLEQIQFLEHSNPTIEPNQLVTQDLSFQAQTMTVEIDDS